MIGMFSLNWLLKGRNLRDIPRDVQLNMEDNTIYTLGSKYGNFVGMDILIDNPTANDLTCYIDGVKRTVKADSSLAFSNVPFLRVQKDSDLIVSIAGISFNLLEVR